MTSPLPHWYLLGAGNMGTLAAWYLTQAGHAVTVIKANSPSMLNKSLHFPDGRTLPLALPVRAPEQLAAPIDHLIVAVKTPYSRTALDPLNHLLHAGSHVIRLQNGLGALDGILPAGITPLEAVSTSAVKGQHPDHEIVAENTTWLGGNSPQPAWFSGLQRHWPNLQWANNIHVPQWQKLVANAVINPLTALYDVPNGQILEDPDLHQQAERLCAEADATLSALDPDWPGQSLKNVLAVAKATAGNTSSMRADRQRGANTEINAINGWIVKQAEQLGIEVPENKAMVDALSD
ncbi:ketopantoate reductase family protein [Alcanivorax sp. DP30]|uniref:ketopantoate reductase family protein n=1 Tax=Alcanivorax sp. DP30 TaxID=2606217 RepID=UPI0013706DED|nr:2-dehydropantoate 2-reductase [Alcanivorax sp. DP30]MZR62422.1 2-dehydropantoate 2-reductase [Alcanivorax sp. DP30]